MPDWIKKFVNAMENSCYDKEKRDLVYKGRKINLGMIKRMWRKNTGGISILRTTKLTDEHFHKNAHSQMRVHLVVQVLSMSVLEMLKSYCKDNIERLDEYSSIMLIVEKLNTVVDIWNHPSTKTFKCELNGERYVPISSMHCEYIQYLEDVLAIFAQWYQESKNDKKPYNFRLKTLYESFAWLVYGLKGVAGQIPDGCSMVVQCQGGTDDVEQEFGRNRQMNSNPKLADIRGQIARGTGVRAGDFTRQTKNNTSGNKRVFYKELMNVKMKKK